MARVIERVLVVEDDPGRREALAECVATYDVAVSVAGDATEALALLRSGPAPDAVLLDPTPERGGGALLGAMRADPALAGIAVIALTRPPAAAPPVQAALAKPFDLDELAGALGRLPRPTRAG